jgi:P27 family predicted phage terminase small subunit
MPGRKPKPTALKVLQGNPGKRRLNREEPAYGPGAPEKPEWLDRYASEEWDRLVAILVPARVITTGDLGILVIACTAYAQLRECAAFLKTKKALSYDASSANGGTSYKPYPEVGQRNMARRQYQSALSELGLSPSSRTKVKSIPEVKESGVKRLLG